MVYARLRPGARFSNFQARAVSLCRVPIMPVSVAVGGRKCCCCRSRSARPSSPSPISLRSANNATSAAKNAARSEGWSGRVALMMASVCLSVRVITFGPKEGSKSCRPRKKISSACSSRVSVSAYRVFPEGSALSFRAFAGLDQDQESGHTGCDEGHRVGRTC